MNNFYFQTLSLLGIAPRVFSMLGEEQSLQDYVISPFKNTPFLLRRAFLFLSAVAMIRTSADCQLLVWIRLRETCLSSVFERLTAW